MEPLLCLITCLIHAHTLASITLDHLHTFPSLGLLLKLFYLLGTHLLPTTVSILYNNELSSFKGKFHLFHNTLHVPLLGKPPSTFTLLSGALHIMPRCLGLMPFSVCPMTKNCHGDCV